MWWLYKTVTWVGPKETQSATRPFLSSSLWIGSLRWMFQRSRGYFGKLERLNREKSLWVPKWKLKHLRNERNDRLTGWYSVESKWWERPQAWSREVGSPPRPRLEPPGGRPAWGPGLPPWWLAPFQEATVSQHWPLGVERQEGKSNWLAGLGCCAVSFSQEKTVFE